MLLGTIPPFLSHLLVQDDMDLEEARKLQECFLAFCGLLQWSKACFDHFAALAERIKRSTNLVVTPAHARADFILETHSRCHLFVDASWQLLSNRDWLENFFKYRDLDNSEIDAFPCRDVQDLRNMREHAREYLEGRGKKKHRWVFESSLGVADASSLADTRIGGRLDYVAFGQAPCDLPLRVQALPVCYPTMEATALIRADLRSNKRA